MLCSFPNQYLVTALLVIGEFSCVYAQSSVPSCTEVHVYASVLNRNKQVVGGLLPQDFYAQLNGKPAMVRDVEHDVARHRIAILIDHSGSMLSVWQATYGATVELLRQLPEVPTSVTFFDEEIRELAPFTRDRQAVQTLLNQFFTASTPKMKRTRLFDALDLTLTKMTPSAPGDIIYVITDGGDNASKRLEKIKKQLVSTRTRLFAVIIASSEPQSPEELDGLRGVHEIVRQTGGAFLDWNAHSGERSLSKKEISEIYIGTRWLVQNMVDDYDVLLDSGQPLPARAKVKLQVTMPGLQDPEDNKFEVMTPPLIATGCH